MGRLGRLLRQKLIIGLLVAYLLGFTVIRQVELYAGDPEEGDKDCPIRAFDDPAPRIEVASVREPPIPIENRNGTVNDASCLNRTRVFGVVSVQGEQEIRSALEYAREEGIPVSIAGRRHSMGGQSFFPDALVLDMRAHNRMSVDEERGTLTVETGATWQEVLDYIHPLGYSVEAMQAIDILTVGGSVAVNAHGIDHRSGSIASSIRSLRIMLADGTVHQVSRTVEPELFHAAIGGYGLFGVILDVELSLAENTMYRFDSRILETSAFPAIFEEEILGNDDYRLMYIHLSTDPTTLLQEAILYTHEATEFDEEIPSLREPGRLSVRGGRFMLNLAKTGEPGQHLKWFGQKHILPWFRQCHTSRNEALREPETCLVPRNQALSQSLTLLKNKLPDDTDILQEYFVPRQNLLPFLDSMRQTLRDNEAVLLNASVRVIHREDILLNYAPKDMFSVVLYLNQEVSEAGNEKMARLTTELIDVAADHGGTFYLPYQLHYTRAQLERAYPELESFFALKLQYDPGALFKNHWYQRYTDADYAAGDSVTEASRVLVPDEPSGMTGVTDPRPRVARPHLPLSLGPRAPPNSVRRPVVAS